MLADAEGHVFSLRDRLEQTEHNVEDLLLCLQAMRVDDVPAMSWSWDENAWHPESIPDEHYPQYFACDTGPSTVEYHVIWSAPLGKRGHREWHDAERYLAGTGRQVLLFDYRLDVNRAAERDQAIAGGQAAGNQAAADDSPLRLTCDSIHVVVAMYEAAPLRTAYASERGNKIKVDVPLLVTLAQWIDELKAYLPLEQQARSVIARRAGRHEDLNLHSNE
jgi:hypothetical protein